MNQAIILYDGNCTLCRRTMKTLKCLDVFNHLKPINVLSADATSVIKSLNLKLEDLLFDMHIIEGSRSWKGYQAYQRISLHVALLWILVPLLYFPPIKFIGERIYRRIADSRTCQVGSLKVNP